MILVKIRNGNYEGIINLEFVRTMYVSYENGREEFVIKAVFGNTDCILINRYKEKEEAYRTIRLLAKAVEDNEKVVYLNVNDYRYKEENKSND